MKLFSVLAPGENLPAKAKNRVFLVHDKWDDWGKYRTQFGLVVFGVDETPFRVGEVKIASEGLQPSMEVKPGFRAPVLEKTFDQLGEDFFSLGQGEYYYEALNTLAPDLRIRILVGLRDCAYDENRFEKFLNEPAMTESLLRSVAENTVRTRLRRMAHGDARLTRYHFGFTFPDWNLSEGSAKLEFEVVPNSIPPTNIHVLVGRNGVGKSRSIHRIAAIVANAKDTSPSQGSLFQVSGTAESKFLDGAQEWSFASLVLVSFSAFDSTVDFGPKDGAISSSVVGLQKRVTADTDEDLRTKNSDDLAREFAESFKSCKQGLKPDRLRKALDTLSSDPLFADANIASYIDMSDTEAFFELPELFRSLSSGHAIILLTIAKLVSLVEEKTLVLIDEPESHLHPPLLASFVRALADLLVSRNAVAIVATHSPVVLQEVPKSCVWKIFREGTMSRFERPEIETFGESVGVLTREAFGLEVTDSGFHRLLRQAIDRGLSYEQLVGEFSGQLGSEARAIARALAATRDSKEPLG